MTGPKTVPKMTAKEANTWATEPVDKIYGRLIDKPGLGAPDPRWRQGTCKGLPDKKTYRASKTR
jgi:hypothetical protein